MINMTYSVLKKIINSIDYIELKDSYSNITVKIVPSIGNLIFSINKKGEEYLVRNEFFEGRYVNTEKGFGVRLVRNADSKVDYTINSLVLNEAMMAQQSLIWSEMLTEQKALEYIADFVPTLLNENYKHLLN